MSSPVEIRGGHGGDGELSVLEVPSSYHRATGLAGQRDAAGYAVAHAYPVARRESVGLSWPGGTESSP